MTSQSTDSIISIIVIGAGYAVRAPDSVAAHLRMGCAVAIPIGAVLDPNVVSRADGGTVVTVARTPVVGAAAVSRYLLGVLGQRQARGGPVEVTMESVNDRTDWSSIRAAASSAWSTWPSPAVWSPRSRCW